MLNSAAICVVDDDSSVLKALARLLSSAGWTAELFSDPEKFLSHARIHQPAVAVLDIWMPLMNGLEVQSRLSQISPSTRVIILTGKEDPQVRSSAIDAGAVAFLSKPFDDEEFLTAVRLAVPNPLQSSAPRSGPSSSKRVPDEVQFLESRHLLIWRPRGILTEAVVDEIVAYLGEVEERAGDPFNRFADLSALDAIDLNFRYVFDVALHRRLSYASHPPIKSAFFVASPAAEHVAKIHVLFTDQSAIKPRLFKERAAAASWLDVPLDVLEMDLLP